MKTPQKFSSLQSSLRLDERKLSPELPNDNFRFIFRSLCKVKQFADLVCAYRVIMNSHWGRGYLRNLYFENWGNFDDVGIIRGLLVSVDG